MERVLAAEFADWSGKFLEHDDGGMICVGRALPRGTQAVAFQLRSDRWSRLEGFCALRCLKL